jgi:hypothetical protein
MSLLVTNALVAKCRSRHVLNGSVKKVPPRETTQNVYIKHNIQKSNGGRYTVGGWRKQDCFIQYLVTYSVGTSTLNNISLAVLRDLMQCANKCVHLVQTVNHKVHSALDRAYLDSTSQYCTHTHTLYSSQSVLRSVQHTALCLTAWPTGCHVTLQCFVADCCWCSCCLAYSWRLQ